MLRIERDGEGYLRELSLEWVVIEWVAVEWVAVECVAVAQQHAERDLRFGENAAYSNEKLRECDGLPKN